MDPTLAKDRPIIIVCRSGRRSRQAVSILSSSGHSNVSILQGGMLAWESAGLLEAIDAYADKNRSNNRSGPEKNK
jgi:rhodanese-related sulfurtransferase